MRATCMLSSEHAWSCWISRGDFTAAMAKSSSGVSSWSKTLLDGVAGSLVPGIATSNGLGVVRHLVGRYDEWYTAQLALLCAEAVVWFGDHCDGQSAMLRSVIALCAQESPASTWPSIDAGGLWLPISLLGQHIGASNTNACRNLPVTEPASAAFITLLCSCYTARRFSTGAQHTSTALGYIVQLGAGRRPSCSSSRSAAATIMVEPSTPEPAPACSSC